MKQSQKNLQTYKLKINLKEFVILGSTLTKDNCCKVKIIRNIALDKPDFQKNKIVLTNNQISKEARKEFVKTFIWNVLVDYR